MKYAILLVMLMNNRVVTMLRVVVLMVPLLTTGRVFGGNAEDGNIGMLDTEVTPEN